MSRAKTTCEYPGCIRPQVSMGRHKGAKDAPWYSRWCRFHRPAKNHAGIELKPPGEQR